METDPRRDKFPNRDIDGRKTFLMSIHVDRVSFQNLYRASDFTGTTLVHVS
jgi:hypothetical protein